ncbi:hypothetical protein AKO1_015001 [Acrasis kona]|uniref:DNA oxidative demethylase ALKBH2 n=1 Tax=Acrasis kona TaxID=1008807 RepID=A0AAW2Z0Z4_9EUKA
MICMEGRTTNYLESIKKRVQNKKRSIQATNDEETFITSNKKQRIEETQLKRQWIINADTKVEYLDSFLSKSDADDLYLRLYKEIMWVQEEIMMMGKKLLPSRRTQTYGDDGLTYRYSGTTKQALQWIEPLITLKQYVERATGKTYNFALCNLYRNGDDYIGPHSDDERDLDREQGIASVSLGHSRDFKLHNKLDRDLNKTVNLKHGSLIVMSGDCQKEYKHSVPKRKDCKRPRINITFRKIVN